MTKILFAILLTAGLTGCATIDNQTDTRVVTRTVYVSPYYPAPGHHWHWGWSHRHGWAWHHPRSYNFHHHHVVPRGVEPRRTIPTPIVPPRESIPLPRNEHYK